MSAAATIQLPLFGSTTIRSQIFRYTQILYDTSACLPGITGKKIVFNSVVLVWLSAGPKICYNYY